MENTSEDNKMSIVSSEKILSHILEQDNAWWDGDGEVETHQCPLTRHGNLVSVIHKDFRKLSPEHCAFQNYDHNERSNNEDSEDTPRGQEGLFGKISPTLDNSPSDKDEGEGMSRSRSVPHRSPQHRQRTRHCSERLPNRRCSILVRESSRLGESMSPQLGRAPRQIYSSLESLQSRGSDQTQRTSGQSRELYNSVSLCCQHPVLSEVQRVHDAKVSGESDQSDNDASSLDLLRNWKRKNLSEELRGYLRLVFSLGIQKHKTYQDIIYKRSKDNKKSPPHKECLLSQLSLLEMDSNPYYRPDSFQTCYDYKAWQDRERKEITQLLGGKISLSRDRKKERKLLRNRCVDYKVLLKKIMTYDLERLSSNHHEHSLTDVNMSGASNSSTVSFHGLDSILSNVGKRLLQEYSAWYRVSLTTQLCMYLQVAEECVSEKQLHFDSVTTMMTLTTKLNKLFDLVTERRLHLLKCEVEVIINVLKSFIQRIKEHVMTLLTEWEPTTDQLKCGLDLASSCFQFKDFLMDQEMSEWPECLSKWFEAATIDHYHSHKKPELEISPTAVLLSVSHAVDVMRKMQNPDCSNTQANYQAAFGLYINNFPQAVSTGLYEAVMTDVRLLVSALPWLHPGHPVIRNQYDGTELKKNDELDLACLPLAYKLSEFDRVVNFHEMGEEFHNHHDLSFSWHVSYHELTMYWLDILSCHMRKLVLRSVALDDFNGPGTENDVSDMAQNLVRRNRTKSKYEDSAIPLNQKQRSFKKKEDVESEMQQTSFISPGSEAFSFTTVQKINHLDEDEVSSNMPKVFEAELKRQHEPQLVLDSDTLDEESFIKSSYVDVLSEDPQSSCVLISYRKLDDRDDFDSTWSDSYHSIPTDESSATKFNSVVSTTSDQSFSSAVSGSNTSSDVLNNSGSSTCVSDTCSSLPQLIQCADPSELDPSCSGLTSPVLFTYGLNSPGSASTSSISSLGSDSSIPIHRNIPCNISSSLVDVIAVLSRFAHFVRTIIDTVYTLPNASTDDVNPQSEINSDLNNCKARLFQEIKERFTQKTSQNGGPSHATEVWTSPAKFSRDMEYHLLQELRDRFVEKALQAMCGIIQQYTNNMLSIDLASIPNDAARLIGKRLYRQITNGIFNKTVLRCHYTTESFHILPKDDENDWKLRIAKKMFTRLNNTLVLKHGISDLWIHLSDILMPGWNIGPDPTTTGTSLPSRNSAASLPSHPTPQSSDTEQNHDTPSGAESLSSPYTSSSVCTAIYRGERQDDKNNNNCEETLDSYDLDTLFCPDIVPQKILPPFNVNQVLERENAEDDIYLMRPGWDFLKENLKSHLHTSVKAISGVIAYQAREWFGHFLDATLDCPAKTRKGGKKELEETLVLHVSTLLESFSKSIHKEGINAVHEMLWIQIMQDFKSKIISLKAIDSAYSKIHAEHTLHVINAVIDAWYRHPSRPNGANLEWLVKPIKPSLTLLELYCLSTPSLLDMYEDFEEELILTFNSKSFLNSNEITNLREVMSLCMRALQDKKSFSGEILHQTARSILVARDPDTSDSAFSDSEDLCQQMLDLNLIQFAFKRNFRHSPNLPQLTPVDKNSLGQDSDIEREGRTSSESTGTSVQSSSITDETSSSISEMGRTFFPRPDYIYRFSQVRHTVTLMDDMKETSQSPVEQNLSDSFLVKLLLMRSKTDRKARRFLQNHGHLPRSVFTSCFCLQ